jgi:hypothetical protein
MGCSPKSTTIFFFGYFGPFGGSHPKRRLSRLGGVGSIDAFIQESEKSLATHVGLFSLKLERMAQRDGQRQRGATTKIIY